MTPLSRLARFRLRRLHRPIRVRAIVLNAPRKAYRNLLVDAAQVAAIIVVARVQRADFLLMQETYTGAQRAWLQRAGWRFIMATPNTVKGQFRVGNSMAIRKRRWFVANADDIAAPMNLHYAGATVQLRPYKRRLKRLAKAGLKLPYVRLVSFHFPRKPLASPVMDSELASTVAEHVGWADHSIAGGDTNDVSLIKRLTPDSHAAPYAGVTAASWRGFTKVKGWTVVKGVAGRVTDHKEGALVTEGWLELDA